MAITININGLSLCHKGSGGKAHNTVPDVCKTPGNGVPVPYQNEAYSRDLVKGTTSTFADGGNMIANDGSQFAKSVFDDAGSMGGVVSGTHLAETDWISHSFNVFIEGRPACRLTDKLFMNHRNTVCLAGNQQESVSVNKAKHAKRKSQLTRTKAFDKAGIETTRHFRRRLAQRQDRGITERNALDAYRNGRLYYNEASKNYIRHSSRTNVSVVTDAATGGRAITVFEGNPSPTWNPIGWRIGQ